MSIHDLARGTEGGHPIRLTGSLPPGDRDTLVLYRPGEPAKLDHGARSGPARIVPADGPTRLPTRPALGVVEPEDDGRWTLWTFAPPTQLLCTGVLPVRMSDAVREALGLSVGDDLLPRLTLGFQGSERAGVVAIQHLDASLGRGGRPLAVYHHKNQKRCWLLVRPHLDGADSWLEVTDEPISERKFTEKRYLGPNALLLSTEGATWRIDPEGRVDEAEILPLQPRSTGQLAGWARYVALDAETRLRQSMARQRHPLAFDHCEQDGTSPRWTARIHRSALKDEALDAWFPDLDDTRHEHRIDATVTLANRPNGRLSLEAYKAESAEVVRVRLKASEDHPPLPAKGNLYGADDKGAQIKADRERAALDRLFAGTSALPTLAGLLDEPHLAEEADLPRLASTRTQLNEDQRNAIRKILGCRDLVAILGPPGTGKTSVIAEALRQIALRGSADNTAPRVLVTSVQNEAVHNVAERVAEQAGLVVHHIMSSRSDDEALRERAEAMERQRAGVVRRLEAALAQSTVAQRREVARDALTRVEALRRRARSHPANAVADALALPDLPTSIGQELERVARDLAAPPDPGPVQAEDRPALPSIPEDPSDVAGWWLSAEPALALADRAPVKIRVDAVARAVERAAKRPAAAARVEAAMQGLRGALPSSPDPAQPPPKPAAHDEASEVPEAAARLDALLATLCRRARDLVAAIDGEPDAIAQRFLHAIQEDTRTWSVIVERHGNTVASTTSMSGRRQAGPAAYDWVIVDEAGRATPPELMVPLVQGRRVILIGDHLQLPPTVEDALIEKVAAEGEFSTHSFEETLFQRIFEQLPPGSRQQLSTQYRMHGDIGTVIDQLFYRRHGLQLHSHFSGPAAIERTPTWGRFHDKPLVFVPTSTHGKPCSEDNPAEVLALLQILEGYVAAGLDGSEPGQQIGVLVPYRRQRKRVHDALQESRHAHLRRAAVVGTIDAMQGREFPVVLFCTTRSDKRPGFMAATNRVNVALSRAQRQLVVLGDPETLMSSRVRTRAPHLYALMTVHLPHDGGHWFRPEGTPWI